MRRLQPHILCSDIRHYLPNFQGWVVNGFVYSQLYPVREFMKPIETTSTLCTVSYYLSLLVRASLSAFLTTPLHPEVSLASLRLPNRLELVAEQPLLCTLSFLNPSRHAAILLCCSICCTDSPQVGAKRGKCRQAGSCTAISATTALISKKHHLS